MIHSLCSWWYSGVSAKAMQAAKKEERGPRLPCSQTAIQPMGSSTACVSARVVVRLEREWSGVEWGHQASGLRVLLSYFEKDGENPCEIEMSLPDKSFFVDFLCYASFSQISSTVFSRSASLFLRWKPIPGRSGWT